MENKVKVAKGFKFQRDVETKFGVLPIIATVTFTEISEHEKAEIAEEGIEFNTFIDVRTYIYGCEDVYYGCIGMVNIDMNDKNALLTCATNIMNNHQKSFAENAAIELYMEAESKFWSLFEDKSKPDMSEYRNAKQR